MGDGPARDGEIGIALAQHFGRRAYGSITDVQGMATWLGAGLGPLVAGWLYDRSGGYALALWLAVAALALSALAVAFTPRPAGATAVTG